jgi:hypothetical protein
MQGKDQVRVTAKAMALATFQCEHPEASSDQAHAFADRSWPGFVDRAIEFLAVRAALCEQDAAPSN